MNSVELSLALEHHAGEVLRSDIKLMDNRHDAPGYILFATAEAGKYVAYLLWAATADSPAPFCFAFQLTEEMTTDSVKEAIISAQNKFISDVERFRALSRKTISMQGSPGQVQEWFGGSLEMFGKNPHGKSKYRVIYAPTRLYLVGGRWIDREEGRIVRTVDEYRWIPRYGETDGWVLEKWLSAEQYAGSKEAWELSIDCDTDCDACRSTGVLHGAQCGACGGNGKIEGSGLYPLGPYPSQGEWESCYTFTAHPPFSAVMQVIQMIEYGKRKFSFTDIRQAHADAIAGKKQERGRIMGDMVKDAMPVAWGKGLNLTPGRDTFGHEKTAEDTKGTLGEAGEFKQHFIN